MATEFKLPELGENIKSGDVLKVLVAEGDELRRDQPVVEVETEKAAIEVPSNIAGVVEKVLVKPGDKVKPGQALIRVGSAASEPRAETPAQPAAAAERPSAPAPSAPPPPAARPAQPEPAARAAEALAPAAPSVRRFARELGLDIASVRGSGPGGRISIEDVKAHAKALLEGARAAAGAPAAVPLPDFSRFGEIERARASGIRRKTAEHLAHAWRTAPQVTQYDKADITELEDLRRRYGARFEAAGGKLTVTAVAVWVLARALKKFPQFNASFDEAAGDLIRKKYCHLGVAVDTEHGLLVPVLRDADRKNLLQLAVELSELAEKARARKLTPEQMQGGCMTITNLGGIGGTAFSPIVNWPEVAILGIARDAWEQVWAGAAFAPRFMMPLSLSYDHRVIDGADGARFLRWVCDAFQKPLMLALEGLL